MIPKIAHFYYTPSDKVPRLRERSWETFGALNPDWEVRRYGYECHDDLSLLQRVVNSDLSRYELLTWHGGFHFDTDIIFRKPIPEDWLEHDNAMMLYDDGIARGVGVLGAKKGSVFFREIYRKAEMRAQSPIVLGYQSLGVKLLHDIDGPSTDLRAFAAKLGEGLHSLPFESFFPVDWNQVELLWSPGYPQLNGTTIGVHWFGGDILSQEYEAMEELPDCLVKSLLT